MTLKGDLNVEGNTLTSRNATTEDNLMKLGSGNTIVQIMEEKI